MKRPSYFYIPMVLGMLLPGIYLSAQPPILSPWLSAASANESFVFHPDEFQQALLSCSSRWATNEDTPVSLLLPQAEGGERLYHIWRSEQMAPFLQEQFPEIQSYYGEAVDDARAAVYLAVSPKRVKVLYFSVAGMTHVLEPSRDSTATYRFVPRSEWALPPLAERDCRTGSSVPTQKSAQETEAESRRGNTSLYRYRLALACTGEYAQYHGATPESVLAAMNELLLQVNAIYERELSVHFDLVADNQQLLFLDPATDPYDNTRAETLAGTNRLVCNQLIGYRNFDVGMVLSTAFGGQARIGAACMGSSKGQAFSGLPEPEGYYLGTIVAHELAHLLGAQHTHSNACNRNSRTAYEPGSGTTLMSYAGICAPNIQSLPDDYFHGYTLAELSPKVTRGWIFGCVPGIPLDNHPPVVDAGPDLVLPSGTPFELRGQAYDPDGDSLSYRWEQVDRWSSYASTAPLWRSQPPSTTPNRLMGLPATDQRSGWEPLPSQVGTYRFRLTVRDHHRGLGTTVYDDIRVTFIDPAPTAAALPTTAPLVTKLPAATAAVVNRIFPNPSSGTIMVELSALPDAASNLRILNSWGQEVLVQDRLPAERSLSLDLSSLPTGLYWVRLRLNGAVWSYRVVLND